jgi:hypothetical protein
MVDQAAMRVVVAANRRGRFGTHVEHSVPISVP